MGPRGVGRLPRMMLAAAAFVIGVLTCAVGGAEERRSTPLSWDTGEGKSYWIPALEIGGFSVGVTQLNRHPQADSRSDNAADTVWKNSRAAPGHDKEPYHVNQVRHPPPRRT